MQSIHRVYCHHDKIMKPKNLIFTVSMLGAIALVLFLRSISNPSTQAKEEPTQPKPKASLVVDEGDHPLQPCLPPNATYRETLLQIDGYSLLAYTFEVPKPKPGVDYQNNHGISPAHPNFNVAIGVLDPFDGCKPTIKNMLFEAMPQSWPEKQRVIMKKAFWVAYLNEVKETLNVTPQSWLDIQTRYTGPSELVLQPDDIKALNALGRKLPKWYDLSIPEEQRHTLMRNRPVIDPSYIEGDSIQDSTDGKNQDTQEPD